jgi:hypothetical protein
MAKITRNELEEQLQGLFPDTFQPSRKYPDRYIVDWVYYGEMSSDDSMEASEKHIIEKLEYLFDTYSNLEVRTGEGVYDPETPAYPVYVWASVST